jgi:hypothetical protein
MNFASFPLIALLVLADAISRIDYDGVNAERETVREAIRDAVAAAIAAQDSPALPSDTIAPWDDVSTAAQALLDAFGSDVPDWLRSEASALEAVLLHAGDSAPGAFPN